jgi:uncharacterized membrane protein YagU involved in acid resistance
MTTAESRDMRSFPLGAILLGGLVAGTIDIGAAALINTTDPLIILRAIASGVLGRAAFQGGLPVSALGLVLQEAMSLVIAAIYVLAAVRLPVLIRRWIPASLFYGVVIYVVMTFIVVPLSAAPMKLHFALVRNAEDLAAMLLFGLIIGFCTQYVAGRRQG